MNKSIQNTTTIRFNDDYTREIIDKAAALLNQTRTGFLLSSARQKAEEVVKDRLTIMQEMKTLYLSPNDSKQFIDDVFINPAKPNDAIIEATKKLKESGIINE
jgi:uncharacterized protein (DUF1778 family)